MPELDEHAEKLKARLSELKADMERVARELKTAAGGARGDLEKSLRILKDRREELDRALGAVKTGSEKAWEELKGSTEVAWKAVQEAWQKAKADWDRA